MQRLQRRIKEGGNYFAAPKKDVEFFSSGSKVLDLALGGGWAEGTIANIVGDKSTGKTLLAIEAASNFARKYPKGRIRYLEAEAAFQKDYAAALGMPVDRVDFGDEPLETVEDLFHDLNKHSGGKTPTLTIVDSLDALSDEAELKREFGKATFGAQKAKDMSKMFRMLVRRMHVNNTLIVISQIRSKIGVKFGRTWDRAGGRAMDFYASHVVYLAAGERQRTSNKGISRVTGVTIKALVDKNKVALPYRTAEFEISFGFGVDDMTSCLNFLVESGALDEIGVRKDQIKQHARSMMNAADREYDQFVDKLHSAVERRWYEIEKTFLPKRTKYR